MNAALASSRRMPPLTLFRFALRDLRGGLAGLRIVVLCIALGVAAIVGVNSLARSLEAGLARDGRTILGGDVSFSLISSRARPPTKSAFLASPRRALDDRDLSGDGAESRRESRRWSKPRRSTTPGHGSARRSSSRR